MPPSPEFYSNRQCANSDTKSKSSTGTLHPFQVFPIPKYIRLRAQTPQSEAQGRQALSVSRNKTLPLRHSLPRVTTCVTNVLQSTPVLLNLPQT